MNQTETIVNYLQRYIQVIDSYHRNLLEQIKNGSINNSLKIKCELVGLIPDDIKPEIATGLMGECILILHPYSDNEQSQGKIILSVNEIQAYNESIITYCFSKIHLLKNNSLDIRNEENENPMIEHDSKSSEQPLSYLLNNNNEVDFNNVSDSDLRIREQKLEKEIYEWGEKSYKNLAKLSDVVENNGNLCLLQLSNIGFVPLKDLTEPNSDKKIFSDKTLKLFTKEYNDYEDLKYQLHKIKEELHYRTYGRTIPYPPHPRDLDRLKPIFNILSKDSPKNQTNYNFLDEFFEYSVFQNEFKKIRPAESNEPNKTINNEQQKVRLQDDSEAIGKASLKTKVFAVLQENMALVLEKLPKKEQKQNKIWKLTTGQVYIKLFRNNYLKHKGTIMRYIKTFRSDNDKK